MMNNRVSILTLEVKPMKKVLLRLWREEEGQDLTEYGLLLVLLSLAAIASLGTLANAINNTFSAAASALEPPTTTTTT